MGGHADDLRAGLRIEPERRAGDAGALAIHRAERIELTGRAVRAGLDTRDAMGSRQVGGAGEPEKMRRSKLCANSGTELAAARVCLAMAAMTVIWSSSSGAPARASGTEPRFPPPGGGERPRPAHSTRSRVRRWERRAPRRAGPDQGAWRGFEPADRAVDADADPMRQPAPRLPARPASNDQNASESGRVTISRGPTPPRSSRSGATIPRPADPDHRPAAFRASRRGNGEGMSNRKGLPTASVPSALETTLFLESTSRDVPAIGHAVGEKRQESCMAERLKPRIIGGLPFGGAWAADVDHPLRYLAIDDVEQQGDIPGIECTLGRVAIADRHAALLAHRHAGRRGRTPACRQPHTDGHRYRRGLR